MKNYRLHPAFLVCMLFMAFSFCRAQELVQCAKENESHFFETKFDVVYGVDGKFVYKYGVTGWIKFDNATFGDPAPGLIKNGYFVRTKDNSIRIYENANFEPPYLDLPLKDVEYVGDSWNDKISSIKVPEGYKLITFEHRQFAGNALEVTGDWTLSPNYMSWNDRISSFRVVKLPAIAQSNPISKPTPGNIEPLYPSSYVRIYDSPDFTNARQEYGLEPVKDLSAVSKAASAIYVREGYKMIGYDQPNLRGDSIEITGGWSAANRRDWDNRIVSIRLLDKNAQANANNAVAQTNTSNTIPPEISFLKEYVRISTQYHGSSVRLDYSPADKKFPLQSNSRNWKIVPVSQTQYKILLQVNGKYWALGSSRYAVPLLGEDTSGIYQLWHIERLSDGYYKISNSGLVKNGSPGSFLYWGSSINTLFLDVWYENKSANGRWSLLSAGNILSSDQPDDMDNRYYSLVSVRNNKAMCLQSYLMGGDVGTEIIADCKGRDGKIQLIKTFNGDYFIRINRVSSRPPVYYYLNDRVRTIYEAQDPLNPNPAMTWNLKHIGYSVYIITNTKTKQALIVSGGSNASVTIGNPVNNEAAKWYLRW
jgi:hypothetical protein